MTVQEIARMAEKAGGEMAVKGSLLKAVQNAQVSQRDLAPSTPSTLATIAAGKTLGGTLPESLRLAGIGGTIASSMPQSALGKTTLSPQLQQTLAKMMPALDPEWKGALARRMADLAGPKEPGSRLSDTLRAIGLDNQMRQGGTPSTLATIAAGKTLGGTLPESLRLAGIGGTIASSMPQSALGKTTLSPQLQQTLAKMMPALDPEWKGALARRMAGAALTHPLPSGTSRGLFEAPHSVPARRRRTALRPVAPSPPEARPKVLPQEIGEFLAVGLVRADREEAMFLLADAALDEARQHLEEVEERLLRGTGPSFLHAALSASILLRDLANHLFPPQEGEWVSRFGSKHPIGAQHVGNRLSAFVDSRLSSQLSPKEHRLLQATLEVVLRWTGEGHHVPVGRHEAAVRFRQLLEVLAALARAYRSR